MASSEIYGEYKEVWNNQI